MKTAVELLNPTKEILNNRLRNGFSLNELETVVHRTRQDIRVRLESALKTPDSVVGTVDALKTLIAELP